MILRVASNCMESTYSQLSKSKIEKQSDEEVEVEAEKVRV